MVRRIGVDSVGTQGTGRAGTTTRWVGVIRPNSGGRRFDREPMANRPNSTATTRSTTRRDSAGETQPRRVGRKWPNSTANRPVPVWPWVQHGVCSEVVSWVPPRTGPDGTTCSSERCAGFGRRRRRTISLQTRPKGCLLVAPPSRPVTGRPARELRAVSAACSERRSTATIRCYASALAAARCARREVCGMVWIGVRPTGSSQADKHRVRPGPNGPRRRRPPYPTCRPALRRTASHRTTPHRTASHRVGEPCSPTRRSRPGGPGRL